MSAPVKCKRCGKDAEGYATIDEDRYCHGETKPSCYELTSREQSAELLQEYVDRVKSLRDELRKLGVETR